jgi:hypothetical protein
MKPATQTTRPGLNISSGVTVFEMSAMNEPFDHAGNLYMHLTDKTVLHVAAQLGKSVCQDPTHPLVSDLIKSLEQCFPLGRVSFSLPDRDQAMTGSRLLRALHVWRDNHETLNAASLTADTHVLARMTLNANRREVEGALREFLADHPQERLKREQVQAEVAAARGR